MPIQERYSYQGQVFEGTPPCISPVNRAFRYGDGLFETVLVRHGTAIHWDAHMQRMKEGMAILGLDSSAAGMDSLAWRESVEEAVGKLLKDQDATAHGRLRITVYRAGGGLYLPQQDTPELLAEIHPLPGDPWQLRPPLHLCIAHDYPVVHSPLSAVKSLNALPYVMAARHAAAQRMDGAILRNPRNELVECTAANLFLVQQNRILTPWLGSGCLPGILRTRVMALAQGLGMRVQAMPLPLQRLDDASEIFVTSAIQGLQPVGSILETTYAAKHHPVMSTIRDALLQDVG